MKLLKLYLNQKNREYVQTFFFLKTLRISMQRNQILDLYLK